MNYPALDRFNWALDWFDAYAAGNSGLAVHVARVDGVLGVLLPG